MAVPKFNQPLAPACDVMISGNPWGADLRSHVSNVSVNLSLDMAGQFSLDLFGSLDQKISTWFEKSGPLTVGSEVEVKLGYVRDLTTMIVGEITSIEPTFSRNQAPKLKVSGMDFRHRLQRGRKSTPFKNKKDSDIASDIANSAHLTPLVTDSKITHQQITQGNKTDWDFLHDRAKQIGYEIKIEARNLIFRPIAERESVALHLYLTDWLTDFHPRLSSAGQVSEVLVRGWDEKEKKPIIGRVKAGSETAKMGGQKSAGQVAEEAHGEAFEVICTKPVRSQAEADQLASSVLSNISLYLIEGSGNCIGIPELRPGTIIELQGLGAVFSGNYYVQSANHSYSLQSGYRTSFSVKRNAI